MTEYQTTVAKDTPIAITIGNFDGIHLGHQRLLHQVRLIAEELQCVPVIATFAPHTLMVLRPQLDIYYLTTLDEKLALAKKYGGVADSIVIAFSRDVAALSADEFMDDLCSHFSIKGLIVGADFSFGHNRTGNVEFLKVYGEKHNIRVETISLEEASHTRISSTRIRTLISEGHVAEANVLLGHPFILGGIVGHGDERGRLLGFPTANLRPDPHKLLPANGVYAVYATIPSGTKSDPQELPTVYKGVANIGVRPTFNGKERIIEVHLLDANLDLYDQYLTVEFIAYLRGEQRFPGIEALKTQISADIQTAQQILAVRRVSN
jgi:riboflavin kinase/FMN adenylyltransferase